MNRYMLRVAAVSLAALLILPSAAAAEPDSAVLSRNVSDYTGAGSVVAVIGAGFAADHPVFAEAPPSPALTEEEVSAVLPGAYVSEKLAAVWDYAGSDADVTNTSFVGTAAASLAAGRYTGQGDTENEDGTVTHDASFAGAAPDAQLLLFKAAADYSIRIDAAAAASAIRDAVSLGADAIWLDTDSLTRTAALEDSLAKAQASGVPVLIGTGDISTVSPLPEAFPVTYTDRGTMTSLASAAGITAVGAAADPYSGVSSFLLTAGDEGTEIVYTDSCEDYFDRNFASLMAGQSLPLIAVPGVGAAEDYEGLDVTGAVVVVLRGEIPFTEKAQYAAEAGAAALIVVDNGAGISRMALEGAPIPAVMVEESVGASLLGLEGAQVSFPRQQNRRAAFCAAGISEDLSASPAFLCYGQAVYAAIPSSATLEGALYVNVSGTDYAAAGAAGLVARAAEYVRDCGGRRGSALAAAVSSAQPIADEEGDLLSPREVGCGLLAAEGVYAPFTLESESGAAVSLPGDLPYESAVFTVRLTNTTAERQRYTIAVSARGESYTAGEDGVYRLTGTMEPLSGVRAYLGDSYVNIADDSGENVGRVTVDPGVTVEIPLRVTLSDETKRAQSAVFWNGFFADGTVTVTDRAGNTLLHPFSLFFGDWESAPLSDTTVYEESNPVLAQSRLIVRRFDESGSENALVLGARNPYTSFTEYSSEYNLVNPAALRYGWVELELCALRDIDRIEITFYDAERRQVFSRTAPGVSKTLTGGTAVIPLWDFIAPDNEDYLFPDGEYSCEIRLSSSFGGAGDGVQYLGFPFTVDSEKPRLNSLGAYREGDQVFLTVEVEDNQALLDIAVYDTAYSFGISGEAAIAGDTAASLLFDVTQYDAIDPLYIEVTDRAGSYATVRISPAQFEAMLAASEEAKAEAGEGEAA